ncbi:MAG: SMC-Scp complex subunit ScpB [Clostridia bacterium]|nr:SMC-Scp complex subunit ScpB [Clostridia bacterium]MDD4571542.1 SMC-Scp complex subunit ScpB [Clostridia bacterium]
MTVLFAEELKQLIECLLFVSYEPLSEKKLAELTETDIASIRSLLKELEKEYASCGFRLCAIAGGWQFLTQEKFAADIEKLYRPRTQQLSKAALETLAIIAYRQPITRGEIERIRQVNADAVVSKLLEKKLVREVGRRETPGRPVLYGTTRDFLGFFGINNLDDLPSMEGFVAGMDAEDERALFGNEKAADVQSL